MMFIHQTLRYVWLFNKRLIDYIEVKTVMFVTQTSVELFVLYGTLNLGKLPKLIYGMFVCLG